LRQKHQKSVEFSFGLGAAKKKIVLVTSSRADYAHLRWLFDDLAQHPAVELNGIALGPHFSPSFGHTGQAISSLPVTRVECLLDSDTDVGMAKTIGVATLGLADALDRLRPDILLIIADRYEMLAPASVALALRIPIAHVEGGEITVGAIDDAVRNALTQMSHLHFACTPKAAQRIAMMGEEPWRITFSGSLSLDFLKREKLFGKAEIEKKLALDLSKDSVVCIYHPVTLLDDTLAEAEELFAALEGLDQPVHFIYPNADAGSRELIRRAENFRGRRPSRVFTNLDPLTYLSFLKNVGLLVGNSSSGIIECTALEVPVVNVGIRQAGREHAANVIDVPAERTVIGKAIQRGLSPPFRRSVRGLESPYGDGNAARIITDVLVKAPPAAKLLFKHAELL
jgi:UDP-N-acetylglucosamine 2-epimerase (non-hydrolysing)/GDP/UDP-N,N'-diacetylbacillosamine 2-epimerase (hydrolysing)